MTHTLTRENDEQVCSCGLRWGVDESDPHVAPDNTALTTAMDSLTASRLGKVAYTMLSIPCAQIGDSIDAGLILRRLLEERGFEVRVTPKC